MKIFFHKTLLWMIAFGCCWSGLATAQSLPMGLRQAIDIALQQNPETQVAKADIAAATATTKLSQRWLLPQITFTEDMTRGDDPVYAFGMRLRQHQFTSANFAIHELNQPSPLGNFATRLSGQWTLFDSMRTERGIAASKSLQRSANNSAKAVDQKVIFQVVQAYEAVLYAQRQLEVTRYEQETAATLLSSAENHVRAGLTVESDRMAALVNAAARKQELIAAEGEVDLAWAQLRLTVGKPEMAQQELQPITAHNYDLPSIETQIQSALKTRPDLHALQDAQRAQDYSVSAARSSYGPRISAYGNWEEDRGSIGTSGGSNWIAGAQISIDLLPLSKRAELQRERATKAKLDAQVSAYQQSLRMQISQARTHFLVASQQMQTAQTALDAASESKRIVTNRYNAGLATITDLLRAEDASRQSQASYWRAVYGNVVSFAENLFATGTLTPEAAEVLQ